MKAYRETYTNWEEIVVERRKKVNEIEKRFIIFNLFSGYVSYKDFLSITLIILLVVYILGKSKHLIEMQYAGHKTVHF